MIRLTFNNWMLRATSAEPPAYQFDNGTIVVVVDGSIPSGWAWELLLAYEDSLDVAALVPSDGGLTVALSAQQLAFSGYYTLQLRAAQGELVKHSAPVRVYVSGSLSGDAHWPEIPTAFTQVLNRAEAAIADAQEVQEAVATSETAAAQSAGNAAGSASAAAQSATAAAQSTTDAGAYATSAAGSAESAIQSAAEATGSAESAVQSAAEATGSAESAVQRAAEAAGSATDAAESATDAAESATAAAGSAASAAESATAAADAVSKYPRISGTTGNWVVWDAEASGWVDTGVHAQGDPGAVQDVQVDGQSVLLDGAAGISSGAVTKSGMTGDSPAWTPAEQLSARQRLGMDKEWMLVGTISGDDTDRGNIDAGIVVDLTGCTELYFYATITSTATSYIRFKISDYSGYLAATLSSNGTRTYSAYYLTTAFGIRPMSMFYATGSGAMTLGGAGTCYATVNKKISEITSLYISSSEYVTACNIKIYAR